MSDRVLHVALYMERCPLTEEWLHTLLFHLWERGLHCNYNYATAPLTWDEELNVPVDGVIDIDVYEDVPLRDAIQRIVAASGGSIKLYDKEMILHLSLDPSGVPDGFDGPDDFPIRFGQVAFSIQGTLLETDDQLPLSRDLPTGAYLLAPYQQVMLAGAHWMEVLCEECHPIFAVGYDTNRESAEEDERETIEAPLYEGRLPDETAWRSLMYIGPRFINHDFVLSRLAESGRWLKWMKDGGLFIHTPYREYAYENAEAYRHVEQGKTAKKQREFALTIQHYQRAQGIFRSVSNELEARACGWDIESVDLRRRAEEERKGISSQQDVLS